MSAERRGGRRRFEALRALYVQGSGADVRTYTAVEVAAVLDTGEDEARAALDALVVRTLAVCEELQSGYRITSAGIRVLERTLFHRPHTIV